MKTLKLFIVVAILGYSLNACKKSYTIGGSLFSAKVNMTTYDYLKTNHLFDTLVIMIDKAGVKDELNQAGTFFAPTNYSINHFVQARRDSVRLFLNDENYPYTFDSLDLRSLKDTLRSYMFHDRITRDDVTSQLGIYRRSNNGEMRLIQLVVTTDYTNSTTSLTDPKYLYLTKIIEYQGNPVPADSTTLGNVLPGQLLQTRCQTSGILTTTGVLHVLENDHMFDYYNDNK